MRDVIVLLALTGGGIAWLLHLSAAYALVAVGCPRGWPAPGWQIGGLTGLCASLAVAVCALALRRRRRLQRLPDTDPGWQAQRLMLGVGSVLAVLFGIAVMLGGVVALVVPPCQGVAIGGAP